MRGSERPVPAAALCCRALALLILCLQALIPLRELGSVPLAAFLMLFQAAAGTVLALLPWGRSRRRLRPWAALLGLALLPFALRLLGGWALQAAALASRPLSSLASRNAEGLLLALDQGFWPLSLAASWAGISAWLAARKRGFLKAEPLLDAALYLALFLGQSGFRPAWYPHPLALALAAGSFILLEALRLSLADPLPGARRPPASSSPSPERAQGAGRGKAAFRRLALPLSLLPLMALALLFLLGRFNERAAAAGGGLIQPTLFRFDFSRYLKLEPKISLSKDLVLLVRKDESNPSVLMRRMILSGYSKEKGFYAEEGPAGGGLPLRLPLRAAAYAQPPLEGRTPLEQEYYLLNFDPEAFIAMDAPTSSLPLAPWPGSSFKSVYRVESLVPSGNRAAELSGLAGTESADGPPPGMGEAAWRSLCDYGGDKRIRELALQASGGAADYWGKASAIESYLRENYRYSLNPGSAPDGDQLGHFLFVSKKGYCSYFAFSMALMLRSLGVPARVAVGFFLRPDTGVLSLYPVRADMAHAWVEAYFPGHGWIDFDPTSQRVAEGEKLDLGDLPDPSSYLPLVQEILSNRDSLLPAPAAPAPRRAAESALDFLARAARGALASWYLILPALLALTVALRTLLLLAPVALAGDQVRKRLARLAVMTERRRRGGYPRSPALTRVERCRALDAALSASAQRRARPSGHVPPLPGPHERCALLAERFLHGPPPGREELEAFDVALRDANLLWRSGAPAWRRIASCLFLPLPRAKAGLVALVFLSALLSAQSSPAPDGAGAGAQALLSRAQAALQAEDYEGAEALFKRGIALHPADADFPRGLGRLYSQKSLDSLALEAWRRAEALTPDDEGLLLDMSGALSRLNRDGEAASYLERCVALSPADEDAISDLGWEYFKLHRLDEGIALLERATRERGFNRSFAMTLGTLRSEAYEYDEAKRQYLLAIRDAEASSARRFASVAWYNLFILETRFYRFPLAREAADRALADWDRSSARLASGELWQRRMLLGSARREFEAAAASDESPLSGLALADLSRLSGDPRAALRASQAALSREDGSWMANFGTDPVAHERDVLDIVADSLEGLASVELSRPDSGPADRLSSLCGGIAYRARAWFARERYRRLCWRISGSYYNEGLTYLSEINAYDALEGHPSLALAHLRAAEAYETSRVPAAGPSYRVEEALLLRRPAALLAALSSLDGDYERDVAADALRRSRPLAGGDALRAELGSRLFALAPGLVRQAGLSIDATVSIAADSGAGSAALRGTFLPLLSRAGLVPAGEGSPFALSLSLSGGELSATLADSGSGALLASWRGKLSTLSRKGLAAAASSFLDRAFADPGL